MLTAKKNGREIASMVMSQPYDQCVGVVQCTLAGCEAWMAIQTEAVAGESPTAQVAWFLEEHTCRALGANDRDDSRDVSRNELESEFQKYVSVTEHDRACPCKYTTPCHERCTCVEMLSSSGCWRCCTYGSVEQRTAKAVRLAGLIDRSE